MCDVNPDKLEVEEQMISKKNILCGSMCMKCKVEKAVVLVRVHDPLCRSCFLTYVIHKFRSTLGKSKLIQANDNVLLALSGGHSSTALLHLVKDALSEGAHKRLRFSPGVICIDESETLHPSVEQDYSHIKELADQFGYPFFQIPIYKDFANMDKDIDDKATIEKDRCQFIKSFQSISTLTAQQDFLVIRRVSLVVNLARKNNYKKIMFGDTSTSLCMKLLSNISLGRGSTIPLDIGVSDNRFPDITIIRPMRELSSKEVALYNRLCEISVLLPYNIMTAQYSHSSLQQKTEEFIIGLQTGFPHTVNTVFRTGDKVCTNLNVENCTTECPLCQSPVLNLNTITNEQICDENIECCGSNEECNSKSFRLTSEEMKSQLCYGCNLTFKDMEYNVDILPNETLDHASKQLKRKKMKESIEEFLLE